MVITSIVEDVILTNDKKVYNFNKKLEELRQVDLAITSIGINGHIGYNEIGSSCISSGRIVDLHKSTLEHRSLGYTKAFTVGILDILKAKCIITIGVSDGGGNGERKEMKKKAINDAIFTFDVSASFVRFKDDSNFRFIIDADTAGKDLLLD